MNWTKTDAYNLTCGNLNICRVYVRGKWTCELWRMGQQPPALCYGTLEVCKAAAEGLS